MSNERSPQYFHDSIVILDSTNAINSTTASLISYGGMWINNTTPSTNTSSGALVVLGGVAVQQQLSAFSISTGTLDVSGNTVIKGNLIVNGTTTSINSTNVYINDNLLVLNAGPVGTKDAGVLIQRYQIDNDSGLGDVVNSPIALSTTSSAGSTTSVLVLPSGSSVLNDFYNGWWVKITSGVSADNVRQITDYDGATLSATVSSVFTSIPTSGNTIELYNRPYVATFYEEISDNYIFGYTAIDPTSGILTLTSYMSFVASTGNFLGGINVTGGANFSNLSVSGSATIPNLLSTSISSTNLLTTNISSTNLNVTGNSVMGTTSISNLIVTSITSSNISLGTSGTLTVGDLNVTNNATIQNSYITVQTVASSLVTDQTVSNLNVTNSTFTNLVATNGTISSLNTTDLTSANINVTNQTVTNINITGDSTIANLFSNNSTLSNLNTTNITSSTINVTDQTVSNINITGDSTIANLFANNSTLSNLNTTNITSTNILATNISVSSLNVSGVSMIPSAGDIFTELRATFGNNITTPTGILNVSFDYTTVRAFRALISAYINATSDQVALFNLDGVQTDTGLWKLSSSFIGDNTKIQFSITTAGNLLYRSDNYSGFVDGSFRIKANTLSIV